MAIRRIISGGQTGVDQIGLKVGRMLDLETGGTAPKGWRTEEGPCYKLASYGLVESVSSDYRVRTTDNVLNADVTVIFGNTAEPGTKLTIDLCVKSRKPYVTNPSPFTLLCFFRQYEPEVINVAGNRGSKLTAAQRQQYGSTLLSMIESYNGTDRYKI